MSDFYAPSYTKEENELRAKKRDLMDVSDEIELILLMIREKVIARRKYAQHEKNQTLQQVFDFGGSVEIGTFSGDKDINKNVKFIHDYGQKTLRGLFISLKDLMYVQLEYLKFTGKRSEETEKNLEKLIKSIETLPERLEGME